MLRSFLTHICMVFTMMTITTATGIAEEKNTDLGNLDTENVIILELKDGPVKIQLFPDKAPKHVERIKELSREHFYDNIKFHRVIDGFMVQTGDPTGTGMGGSSKTDLKSEFNDIKHVRGIVSMARSMNPHSANSQFFIMLANTPSLDGEYTAFGKVVSGMEYVDKITKGDSADNGAVKNPDKIISMRVLADIQKTNVTK